MIRGPVWENYGGSEGRGVDGRWGHVRVWHVEGVLVMKGGKVG